MRSVTVKNGVNVKTHEYETGKGGRMNPILDSEDTFFVNGKYQKTWRVTFQTMQGDWQQMYSFTNMMEIGRIPSSNGTVKLQLPQDSLVSGTHAVIFTQNDRLYLQDNHSRNSTFLNEEKITGPVEITNGSIVRFGGGSLRVYYDTV